MGTFMRARSRQAHHADATRLNHETRHHHSTAANDESRHANTHSSRIRPTKVLTIGYLITFAAGWIIGNGGSPSFIPTVTREAKEASTSSHHPFQKQPSHIGYTPVSASQLLSQRPNWRTDYDLFNWLPPWLPPETKSRWKSLRTNATHELRLDVETHLGRDDYFWKSMIHDSFSYAIASNGWGHRLGNLAFAYLCNVVPNRRQQVIFWDTPGNDYNTAWHALFEDSPLLIGAPQHWNKRRKFDHVNRHREQQRNVSQRKGFGNGADTVHCDYKEYFPLNQCGQSCRDFDFSRDTWLLRLAREPSAQEFFMLLRAQLRQETKDKIAAFIETNFPYDKIVVGVHVRSGNGKDDGEGDFERKKRGDWLHDLPAAVAMIREHARTVARSSMDRYGFRTKERSETHDGTAMDEDDFRIFLATDSSQVLDEFLHQDPNVLFLPQERMQVGAGVPINKPLKCHNMTSSECSIHAEEAMFIDAMIMSSCDIALAESFSNWMYTLPATLRFAEGRIFCESGRAALGVKEAKDSMFGPASWWAHPPPNAMPVRCYQGGWAARDRFKLMAAEDAVA